MAAIELDFLPAALEIQERPPLSVSQFIIWSIVAFFLLALIWACIGEVNIVAVAAGKTVPSGHVKIIQTFEPGVVRRIHVSDGDYVRPGEVLIELDSTMADAEVKRLQTEAEALALDGIRLEALLSAIHRDGSEDSIGWGDAEAYKRDIQRRRYREQLGEYLSRIAVLVSMRREKQAAAKATAARIAQLDATIPLVKEHSSALHSLVRRHAAARLDWLRLERESIEQSKEREVQHYRLAEIRAALDSLEEQQRQLVAEYSDRIPAPRAC
jgi:hemolysin D